MSVERTVTEAMLDTGEISLGPAEQRRLDLGDQSASLTVTVDGEQLPVVWTAGRRNLSGESLLEYLQDTARIGDLLRLERRADGAMELVVHAPLTNFSGTSSPGWPVAAATLPTASPDVPAAPARSGRRRLARRATRGGRYRLRQPEEYTWHGNIGFFKEAQSHLLKALRERGWDPVDAVEMRLEGERLATLDQFDELLALDAAHIEHMPHQEAAARTVLTRMGGRAVLADEVGLGKTVEAGLILKELLLRGLADRVLIVCPAPLREQWRQELLEKFDEEFVAVVSGQDPSAFEHDRMIMTQHLLVRNAHRLGEPFDLIVLDEAHRLATAGAKRGREVVGELIAQAPRTLFLTATPVQNSLLELYRLIELLRPGTFLSERDFTSRFVDNQDPRRPVNAPELRKLISSVVVRTTRQQAGVDRVHRMPPIDRGVRLTEPERQLYDLLLDTLRNRMTAPGDTMRRRQLALRLTASPQAVSRSALRMAERHPDRQVGKVLTEIGHLAGDIHHTAREQAALQILRPWIDEHGRVLVFTQHTDTLLGLLRLLDAEGITAVPFHGSMSHTARAESVARFRAGKAAVLISTDAGAEGQNLQVSNCVLNYDLPWNPMRVEQRIGRVHRLTQTRNVHIANLFAFDTLDEQVYRLLHDKLAMFELLFGQVVTVLGELDGADQDSSMENRVLEALYQKSDASMQHRLDELGRQLEQARSRAMQMMTADSSLSQWLAQHRAERSVRAAELQATELLPQAADRPRRRQKDLEQFVCQFLARAGAQLEQPSEGFTIVTLPRDLSKALDGREQLYLAFTNAALDAHPDAELCVVGSEVFDELLRALRVRGDLSGSVPRIPGVHQRPVVAHTADVRLVERRIEASDDWSARATYRVQEGAATGNQQLVTVDIGQRPADGADRDPLPDGADLPVELTEPEILATIDRAAANHLNEELKQARLADRQRQQEARKQLIDNLSQQLKEASTRHAWGGGHYEQMERREQLTRALQAAKASTVTEQHFELRAELLTVEVHSSDELYVVEQWEHTAGPRRELRYAWSGDPADHTPTCEATGVPVQTLALCADAHVVDAAALASCELCARQRCGACGPRLAVAACAACGRMACGSCRKRSALCEECRRPERAPDLDSTWERGWRLGAGAQVLVGTDHAILVAADGTRTTMVPDAHLDDPARVRLRGLAARLGLPPSIGLTAEAAPDTAELTDAAVWAQVERSVWWTTAADQGTHVDMAAAECLPDLDGPPVGGEAAAGLAALLAKLRGRKAAPQVPAVVVMPFAAVRRVDVLHGQFVYQELWHDGTGEPGLAVHDTRPLMPSEHAVAPNCRPVARTTVGPVTVDVDGVHRSYLCRLTDGAHTETVFIPGVAGAVAAEEEQLAQVVAGAGLPANRAVVRHPWPGASADELKYTPASSDTQVKRQVSVSRALVDSQGGEPYISQIPSGKRRATLAQAAHLDDIQLRDALHELSPLSFVALTPVLSVDEQWSSTHGKATRRYLVAPAAPIDADLLSGRTLVRPGEMLQAFPEDDAGADVALSVDCRGHLHDSTRSSSCPVCMLSYGRCCGDDGTIAPCRTCERLACGVCRTGQHTDVLTTVCARCGDHSCRDCSRRLSLSACALCGRKMCGTCIAGTMCLTCHRLAPATEDDMRLLPAELAAEGLSVLVANDPAATVALLVGKHRTELALFSGTKVLAWETLRDDPAPVLQARIQAARLIGAGDIDIQQLDAQTPSYDSDELVLERHPSSQLLWFAEHGGEWKAGNSPRPSGILTAAAVDPAALAEAQQQLSEATAAGPLPTATPASRRETVLRHAGKARPTAGQATLVICRQRTEDAILLDARGLVRRWSEGVTTSDEVAAWRVPQEPLDWALRGWLPAPELVAVSTLGAYTAVVAAIGDHALLGLRHGDKPPTWHPLSWDRDDLRRGALGAALLGRPALLSISTMTARSGLRGPTILGAQPHTRQVTPVLALDAESQTGTSSVAPAAALIEVGIAEPYTPALTGTLPEALTSSLLGVVRRRAIEHLHGGIGLHVDEQWRLASGELVPVAYQVPPGQLDGYIRDAVSGSPLRMVPLCRSHHPSEQQSTCSSCLTATCGACLDAVRPCALCGTNLCGRCVASRDGRCPACAVLQKAGLLERRKLDVPRGGTAWHGQAAHTRVVVRQVDDEWSLERADALGQVQLILEGEWLQRVQQMTSSAK
ncbi:helicase-related protein [Dactylosporangium sp. NPDC006015]|uniref:DEAD/DEAH box helicase n=1 Tax=Dactylosporangium sp. NPDC006015 TaxID=3154576 RepID=UPI0033A85DBA